MNMCNPENVRTFITKLYAERIIEQGHAPETLKDDFDLLGSGIIDSLGVLELISAIEEEFHVIVDLQELDAEKLTLLGPLSDYVGRNATAASSAADV